MYQLLFLVIVGLPFSDTGNTSDNLDGYDAVCPYSNSTSPDVVYTETGPTYGFWLPNDCNLPAVHDQVHVGPYNPGTMTIQWDPGFVVWLWVGPGIFTPPA